MLIEGSSGGLVGEHQPDELMRDGGRWAGRPLVVMSEMKVSQEDVAARVQPWRGVGAGTASRFMANTALSRGARTNGAVCAAPGGSRHHLYHRLYFLRREEARDEARVTEKDVEKTLELMDDDGNGYGDSSCSHAANAFVPL